MHVEKVLHKQQGTIGLVTHNYNTLIKINIKYLQVLMNVGYAHTIYKLFDHSWTIGSMAAV